MRQRPAAAVRLTGIDARLTVSRGAPLAICLAPSYNDHDPLGEWSRLVSKTQYAGFLDLLYGAAVEQSDWERVLTRFADLIGGARAWMPDLSLANGLGGGVIARIDPAAQATYFQYFAIPSCRRGWAPPTRPGR